MDHSPPEDERSEAGRLSGQPAAPAVGTSHAAIDLGTSGCRLLIARTTRHNRYRIVDSFSRIVDLGQGLRKNGYVCEAALQRTIDALSICRNKIDQHGITSCRAVATHACRSALNGAEVVDRIREQTRIPLTIISAREEARLSSKGCLELVRASAPTAVLFDIGGGSTEFTLLERKSASHWRLVDVHSVPLGFVALSERIETAGPEGVDAACQQALQDFQASIAPFVDAHNLTTASLRRQVQLLGVSGPPTIVAALAHGLKNYDRRQVDGSFLLMSTIGRVARELRAMSHQQRLELPTIGPERSGAVLGGCVALEAICTLMPVGVIRVADRGVRDGILIDLMNDQSLVHGIIEDMT